MLSAEMMTMLPSDNHTSSSLCRPGVGGLEPLSPSPPSTRARLRDGADIKVWGCRRQVAGTGDDEEVVVIRSSEEALIPKETTRESRRDGARFRLNAQQRASRLWSVFAALLYCASLGHQQKCKRLAARTVTLEWGFAALGIFDRSPWPAGSLPPQHFSRHGARSIPLLRPLRLLSSP